MPSAIAEVLVRLPHLAAIDRLPATVSADGVTVELTGVSEAADVIGSLQAYVRPVRWRHGRRSGGGHVEVLRTHIDRSAVTLVLDGLDAASAYHLVLAARRLMLDAQATVLRPAAPGDGRLAARPATRPA